MISYWIDSYQNPNKFNALTENLYCDVCIIGAGIFGLTTAYYLSKKGLNVILLDKNNIGEGTSGYTTGKITLQHGLIYDYLINNFSFDFTQQYLTANQEAIENIKAIIDNENIDCDFERQSSFVYTTDTAEIVKLEKEADSITSLGLNVSLTSTTSLPFKIASALEIPNQAQFHPQKYMQGLVNSILHNEGIIFTNTHAHSVKKDGNFYNTFTKSYKITSKYVVIASHYPFINIPGFYFTKMYQSTSYAILIDPKKELFNGMYINTKEPILSLRHVKNEEKNLLLIVGNGHKTGDEKDITNSYLTLEKEARKIYPDCDILYKWNTQDCITLDKVPYIGTFSSITPNMYIATGFNKWGMTFSNIAANIIADGILGIENKYSKIFDSTRVSPIKNRWEMKNMIKQTTSSLLLENLKIPDDSLKNIKNDNGAIIELDGKKVGVYRNPDGDIFTIKPNCTHLGCMLTWNNLDKTWDCPCHGSRFNYKGENLYNPAIKNLNIYK